MTSSFASLSLSAPPPSLGSRHRRKNSVSISSPFSSSAAPFMPTPGPAPHQPILLPPPSSSPPQAAHSARSSHLQTSEPSHDLLLIPSPPLVDSSSVPQPPSVPNLAHLSPTLPLAPPYCPASSPPPLHPPLSLAPPALPLPASPSVSDRPDASALLPSHSPCPSSVPAAPPICIRARSSSVTQPVDSNPELVVCPSPSGPGCSPTGPPSLNSPPISPRIPPKRSLPPPLNLGAKASSNSPPSRPVTPLSSGLTFGSPSFQSPTETDSSSPSSSLSPPIGTLHHPDSGGLGSSCNPLNHACPSGAELTSTIEDEERRAAEWMQGQLSGVSLQGPPHDLQHEPGPLYDPLVLMAGLADGAEAANELSTTEKIFLFAKSQNPHHRMIVSQRLPELLEDVDITEAVEYVLPLLTGLANDDDAIREVLASSLCNIMWYFCSRCPVCDLVQSSSSSPLPHPSGPPASQQECQDLDWNSLQRQKRPRISISSFSSPAIALLSDPNSGVALFTRHGVVAFVCRLLEYPLPPWPDEAVNNPCEACLPVERRSREESTTYEEYGFEPSIRQKLASILIDVIVSQLCQFDPPNGALTPRDGSNESELEEWDTEPLIDEQSNLEQPVTTRAFPKHNHRSHNQHGPVGDFVNRDLAVADGLFPTNPIPVRSRRRCTSQPDGQDENPLHLKRQAGMCLIELVVRAGCFDKGFVNEKLLPEVTRVGHGDVPSDLRERTASALTSLLSVLPDSSQPPPRDTGSPAAARDADASRRLFEFYSHLAEDPDHSVRKQTCSGLPALLRVIRHQPLDKEALRFMSRFGQDDSYEVRIEAYHILGELIHHFHERSGSVPDVLVDYFVNGFREVPSSPAMDSFSTSCLRPFVRSPDPIPSTTCFDGVGLSSSPVTGHLPLHFPLDMDHLHHHLEDRERAMNCAFNFPAVLLSLGTARWDELRDLFVQLATDVSRPCRVRRSLACSVHELLTIIRADARKAGRPSTNLDGAAKLARDDCLRIINFFLFADEELKMIEFVFEHFDISFGNLLVHGEDGKDVMDLLSRLNEYFASGEDVIRRVGWRVREQVGLLLPKLLHTLEAFLAESYEVTGATAGLLRDGLKAFEVLMFSGLRDSAAAVREAALNFVPRLYNWDQPDLEEFQFRLINDLRELGWDSNYRIRMMYPSCLLGLVELPMSVQLFETAVVGTDLLRLSEDRVAGVRIALSRLLHGLCHSNHFYGPLSGRRIPRVIRRLIERLSRDHESVVCSFVEGLVRVPDDEFTEEEDLLLRCAVNVEEETSKGAESGLLKASRRVRSLESMATSESGIRTESVGDEDEDDLTGPGIQVYGSRLSEDDDGELSLGSVDSHIVEEQFAQSCNGETDDVIQLLDSPISATELGELMKMANGGNLVPVSEQSLQQSRRSELDDELVVDQSNEVGLIEREERTSPGGIFKSELGRRSEATRMARSGSRDGARGKKKRPSSSTSAASPRWSFSASNGSAEDQSPLGKLNGGCEVGYPEMTQDCEVDRLSQKLACLSGCKDLSPCRKGSRRSMGYNHQVIGVNCSHGGGLLGAAGRTTTSNVVDALWMRETDGGFVEVGEY